MPVASLTLPSSSQGKSSSPAPAFRFRNDELIKFRRGRKRDIHISRPHSEAGKSMETHSLLFA